MTWREPKQALAYLNKHKTLVGLGDYDITVIDMQDHENEAIAETEPDPYEKTLKVVLYSGYATRKDWQTTLLHELVHARVGIASILSDQIVAKARYEAIEQAVNDITRGMQHLKRNS